MILLEPEFFDIFGSLVFIFLIFIGVMGIKKTKIPKLIYWVLLIIGILGLIVDLFFVSKRFLF